MPKEAVTPWGAHAGAGSCQDLWIHGRGMPCQSIFACRACDLMGAACSRRTTARGRGSSQLVRSFSSWEGLMLERFLENSLL